MRTALAGGTLTEPLDPDVAELYNAYRFCKIFHCSIQEYEERSHYETTWLLKIDETYRLAQKDVNERAQSQGG